jgi:hypothetical protein
MYSHSFQDPDGHLWEVMWMDPAGPPADGAATCFLTDHEPGVWLIPLQDLDADARAIQLGRWRNWNSPGQDKFVGDPLRMILAGLAEESRRPYVIESNGGRPWGYSRCRRGQPGLPAGRTTTPPGCFAVSSSTGAGRAKAMVRSLLPPQWRPRKN